MRADAETARLQEDEEARAHRRAAEDALLERAAEVSRARDAAARQLPSSQEPKRGKAHWDFVMEEMAWMAKEFQRCGPGPAHCVLAKVCAQGAKAAGFRFVVLRSWQERRMSEQSKLGMHPCHVTGARTAGSGSGS